MLVMSIGGASGPLFGSMLMAMGEACANDKVDKESLIQMLEAGVEAVKKRGKSDVGDKTMIDVLAPVAETVKREGSIEAVKKAALEATQKTKNMKANKGRAAFLGERSIGHIDPGARSSALLILATCEVMENSDD
ncbi:dihydroxyacetone kinase subunit DhaL [Terasakiella sp. A23]|uniref:dihydroxyacetone kinase subunit DhaL n=1 Tax=Terasakiella sp. FCG-A23 TaxID=3080561 RepID=UPI0029535C27|nr:dihydroxyacetone kinase subunit DhaL [Terasakiella sp. A23]MDV7341755.1 dihydroxyacetone kinase subunit DhaL [Terasakiella sp. A23]